MGTPEFAAAHLQAIVESEHELVGVVTAPDKKAGRGHRIQESAVKETALEHGLPLLQPTSLKDSKFVRDFDAWNADIGVVVAFRMLPEVIWSSPPLGTVNLHASLLPQLRGAAPIQHAILNGLPRSGVTTFLLKHAIDTGDILMQEALDIGDFETAGELHNRLRDLGTSILVATLSAISSGTLLPMPQASLKNEKLLSAGKLFKADGEIDWNRPRKDVHNHIRGMNPFPTAWTQSPHGILKIMEARPGTTSLDIATPGSVHVANERLYIATLDGWMELTRVTPSGKKTLSVSDWMRGLSERPFGIWGRSL